jgi:hypothetical protein
MENGKWEFDSKREHAARVDVQAVNIGLVDVTSDRGRASGSSRRRCGGLHPLHLGLVRGGKSQA